MQDIHTILSTNPATGDEVIKIWDLLKMVQLDGIVWEHVS